VTLPDGSGDTVEITVVPQSATGSLALRVPARLGLPGANSLVWGGSERLTSDLTVASVTVKKDRGVHLDTTVGRDSVGVGGSGGGDAQ
jgi:hypothetical protein